MGETLMATLMIAATSYRLWRVVALDQIGQRLRRWVPEEGWIADMVYCPWCLGLHVTVLVSVAWFLWPGLMIYALVPMTASTIVGALGHLLGDG